MRRGSRVLIASVWIAGSHASLACEGSEAETPANNGGALVTGGAAGEAGEGAVHSGGHGAVAGVSGGLTGGGAEGGAPTPPPCTVSAPTACPEDWPVYADVEPVLEGRCLTCHLGQQGGPWPLTTYAHVTAWRDEIRAALLTCAMPPPEEAAPLSNEESLLILTWIRCGMPP